MTLSDDELRRHLERRAAGAPRAEEVGSMARSAAGSRGRARLRARTRAGWGLIGAAAAAVIAIAGAGTLILRAAPVAPPAASAPSGPTQAASATAIAHTPEPSAAVTQPPPVAAAAWASISWERESGELFAYDHDTYIGDATAFGSGFVAVGYTVEGNDTAVHVWISRDGRTWSVVHPDALRGLDPQRLVVVDGRLVLLANRWPGVGAVTMETWQSDDGVTWERGPSAPRGPVANGRTAAGDLGVVARGNGIDAWLDPSLTGWTRIDGLRTVPAARGGVLTAGHDRWILSGATGSTKAGSPPTVGAVWTSEDLETWTPATVDRPGGNVGEVLPVDGGYVALGSERGLTCDGCLGAIDLRRVAWRSDDGTSWARVEVAGDQRGDPLWASRVLGDGHRAIAIVGSQVVAIGAANPWNPLVETLDGRTWTPIQVSGDGTGPAYGIVAIGPSGIIALDVVDDGKGGDPMAYQPWFGAATETP